MIETSEQAGVAVLRMADGKVNAMSIDFCAAVTTTFEQILPARAVVLTGTGPGLNVTAPTAGVTANVTLDGGTLTLGANNALPVNSTLVLVGGTLQASTAVTLNNAVTLKDSPVTIAGNHSIVMTGAVNLAGTHDSVTVNSTVPNFILTGVVQDLGAGLPVGSTSIACAN